MHISTVVSAGVITAVATLAHAQDWIEIGLPKRIELDLHFPRNETYADVQEFPLVFGINGTQGAWRYGWFLKWRLASVSGSTRDSGEIKVPVNFDDDVPPPSHPFYYIVNSTKEVEPGQWQLEWSFGFPQACREHMTEDGGNVSENVSNYVLIADNLNFTIVAAGDTAGKPVDLGSSGGESCGRVSGVIDVENETSFVKCADILDKDFSNPSRTCVELPADELKTVSSMLPVGATQTPTSSTSTTQSTSQSTGGAMPMMTAAPMLLGMAGVVGAGVML